MFLKTFYAEPPTSSKLFANFHEEYPNCSLLWKFGLDIPLDGVMVTIFVSHSFSCFHDLKLDNDITMATRMVSFNLVFYTLSEKLILSTFNMGNKVLILNEDSQSKI